MSLKLIVPVTAANAAQAVAALVAAGIDLGPALPMSGGIAPPPRPGGTMPPTPGAGGAPPPPPQPAAPAAPANPQMDNVLRLMDTYAKHGHQVAGARKVLQQVGLSRVQDANPEQLGWLEQAFANVNWAPA